MEKANTKQLRTPFQIFGLEGMDKSTWSGGLNAVLDAIEQYNKDKDENDKAIITQVKSKYGGLCIYGFFKTQEIQDLVTMAQRNSYCICEECGDIHNVGQTDGWVYTLCEKCATKNDLMDTWEKRTTVVKVDKFIEICVAIDTFCRKVRVKFDHYWYKIKYFLYLKRQYERNSRKIKARREEAEQKKLSNN